jgi:very-short-patch-repair endonuclease
LKSKKWKRKLSKNYRNQLFEAIAKKAGVKIPSQKSGLESYFLSLITVAGFGKDFKREVKFHPERKWRVDFLDEKHKIAIEIEGGVYTRGRHTRPSGFIADCEKYNQLSICGYRLLRYATKKQMNEMAVSDIMRLIN